MYPAGGQAPQGGGNRFTAAPDGITARYTKLFAVLAWAYDIPGRVFGPDWIFSERYDIAAKAAGPVPEAQLKLITQALLRDRFALTVHRETRELPVAVLTVGANGAKNLRAAEAAKPVDQKIPGYPDPRADFGGQLVVKSA
jgi:uncharacterized protein (TIGR03435 family)